MRPSKKAERAMAKITAMLAESGVSTEDIEAMTEKAPTGREALSRQGEAVLLFLESPAKYTAKLCKRCGEPFGTNYRSVAYCSDTCRAKEMYQQLGVKWNHFKTEEERWGGEPPLIIPPAAFRKIQEFVQFFSDILPIQKEKENPPSSGPKEDLDESFVESGQLVEWSQSQQLPSEVRTTLPQSPPELCPEQETEEEGLFDFL